MSRSTAVRILAGAAGLATLILAAAVAPIKTTIAQAKREAATDAPVPSESLTRAFEDIEALGHLVEAKATALRQAEKALALERVQQADYAKLKKFGITSDIGAMRGQFEVLNRDAERAIRQAELTEAQARLAQARRRVATLERHGPPGAGLLETIGRDLDALTSRMERVEVRLDRFAASLAATREEIRRLDDEIRADREP